MNDKSPALKHIEENYKLIPMSDITDEARILAVRWVEGYEPMGEINLEQKHKLASDIMNYAEFHAKGFGEFLKSYLAVETKKGEKQYWDGVIGGKHFTVNELHELYLKSLKP